MSHRGSKNRDVHVFVYERWPCLFSFSMRGLFWGQGPLIVVCGEHNIGSGIRVALGAVLGVVLGRRMAGGGFETENNNKKNSSFGRPGRTHAVALVFARSANFAMCF